MMMGVGRLLPLAAGLATPLTAEAGVLPASRSTSRSGSAVLVRVIAADSENVYIFSYLFF